MDWFQQAARFGVFTHYLDSLQNQHGPNSQGKNSTWDQCVLEFDVEAYAASAAATGARFAVFTVMQMQPYMTWYMRKGVLRVFMEGSREQEGSREHHGLWVPGAGEHCNTTRLHALCPPETC